MPALPSGVSKIVSPGTIISGGSCAVTRAASLFALEEVAKKLHATGRTLILCGAREQPAQLIHQAEFEDIIGHENICKNVQAALRRAEDVFEKLEANAALGRK
jgi:MFS superfamily sulfate permease-like transporter